MCWRERVSKGRTCWQIPAQRDHLHLMYMFGDLDWKHPCFPSLLFCLLRTSLLSRKNILMEAIKGWSHRSVTTTKTKPDPRESFQIKRCFIMDNLTGARTTRMWMTLLVTGPQIYSVHSTEVTASSKLCVRRAEWHRSLERGRSYAAQRKQCDLWCQGFPIEGPLYKNV